MSLDLEYDSNGALSESSYNRVMAMFHLYDILSRAYGIDLGRATRILEGKEHVKAKFELKLVKAHRRIQEGQVLTTANRQELDNYL